MQILWWKYDYMLSLWYVKYIAFSHKIQPGIHTGHKHSQGIRSNTCFPMFIKPFLCSKCNCTLKWWDFLWFQSIFLLNIYKEIHTGEKYYNYETHLVFQQMPFSWSKCDYTLERLDVLYILLTL